MEYILVNLNQINFHFFHVFLSIRSFEEELLTHIVYSLIYSRNTSMIFLTLNNLEHTLEHTVENFIIFEHCLMLVEIFTNDLVDKKKDEGRWSKICALFCCCLKYTVLISRFRLPFSTLKSLYISTLFQF